MYIPIWVIVLSLLTAAIAAILWQQGKKPSDWYERVIEVVGKPYVLCFHRRNGGFGRGLLVLLGRYYRVCASHG